MKTNKVSVDQRTFEFMQAGEELKVAVDKFTKAAKLLQKAEQQQVVPNEDEFLRNTIRRLVGILVDQSGLSFHAAWVLAYHELHKRTGFHAVVQAAVDKDATLLDAVQRKGLLPQLQETVAGMLMAPEYSRAVRVALPA